MKAVNIAITVFLALTVAVTANSLYIGKLTKDFSEELRAVDIEGDDLAEKFEAISKRFRKAEKFISITVSHDDLTNIEEGFADIIGAAKSGITADVERIKSRLVDSLEHLGRLSAINLDSII